MKRIILVLVAVLLAGNAWAFDCPFLEYAEIKDMDNKYLTEQAVEYHAELKKMNDYLETISTPAGFNTVTSYQRDRAFAFAFQCSDQLDKLKKEAKKRGVNTGVK